MTSNPNYKGSLIFGDYQLDNYAKKGLTEKDIFWANTESNDYYWTIRMDEVRFSDMPVKLNIESKHFILDTGMSFGIIPIQDFNAITEYLFYDKLVDFEESEHFEGYFTAIMNE